EKVVYIADRQNHRIQVFDEQGAFITKWDVFDNVSGKPIKPRDINMDLSGQIYVVDKDGSRINVYGISSEPQLTKEKTSTTPEHAEKTNTKTSTKHTSESNSKGTSTKHKPHSEAKPSSNMLFITFTGFCCDYDGKVTVTLKNTETGKLMGKDA